MTLLLADGFDYASTTTNTNDMLGTNKWTARQVNNLVDVVTTQTRTAGGKSLRCWTNGDYIYRSLAVSDEDATIIVGLGYYRDAASVAEMIRFLSDSGATTHVTISVDANNALTAKRGSTVIGTTVPNVVPIGAWCYIEAKVLLSTTVGTVTLRVNGVSVLALTGQNTKNGGTKTTFDRIAVGNPASNPNSNMYIDDCVILNTAGTVNNDFLGDVRIPSLSPSGNGNTSGLTNSAANSTNNYTYVDDAVPTAGTADYVEGTTNDLKDTYAWADGPTTGVVFAVVVSAYATKSDAGAKSLALVTRSASTDYVSGDTALGFGSNAFVRQIREVDPATSAAWTPANFNAAEFGVQVRP
jgi:hypothetical protein